MIALRARRVLTPKGEREGWWVTVSGDRIADLTPERPAAAEAIDLGDVDLVPGFIDLHSDCLEDKTHPRPTSNLPLPSALLDLDTEAVAYGVTTHFLCVGLDDSGSEHRSAARAAEIVGTLEELRGVLRVDHRLHLRVELTGDDAGRVDGLLRRGVVGLVSYMDHTPGQGQYPDDADYRAFVTRKGDVSEAELDERLARRKARRDRLTELKRAVAGAAKASGAVLASHDDDGRVSVAEAVRLGAAISEFPVNAAAARAARNAGLGTVMGAPNARRGRSHLENLSAREAVEAGLLDALASDYHLPSLLASAYELADAGICPWADAIGLLTSGPAHLAGLDDRGTLAPGKRADLVAVERRAGIPAVAEVWVEGRPVHGVVRRKEAVG